MMRTDDGEEQVSYRFLAASSTVRLRADGWRKTFSCLVTHINT